MSTITQKISLMIALGLFSVVVFAAPAGKGYVDSGETIQNYKVSKVQNAPAAPAASSDAKDAPASSSIIILTPSTTSSNGGAGAPAAPATQVDRTTLTNMENSLADLSKAKLGAPSKVKCDSDSSMAKGGIRCVSQLQK